jgi:hypothetical protein
MSNKNNTGTMKSMVIWGEGLELCISGNFDVSEDITILLGLFFYLDNGNVPV